MSTAPAPDLDLIEGVTAIAEALGMPKRRVSYLIDKKVLPTFRAFPGSRTVSARRSSLAAWLAAAEAAARTSTAA